MTAAERSAIPPGPAAFELFPILPSGWPSDGIGPVATIVAQLPDPAGLVPGEIVIVRDAGPKAKGWRRVAFLLRRIAQKPRRANAAVRCTALLAHGYREIAARRDPRTGEDLVWAVVPTSDRFASAP